LHLQYRIRMTGENGLAQTIIFFSNVLETWNSKLNTYAYSGGKLTESDWLTFYAQMDEWIEAIHKAIGCVSKPTKDSDDLPTDTKKKDAKPM